MNPTRWLAIVCLLLVTSCASTPATHSPCQEWRLAGVHSYERQSPGLGVSRRFNCASAWADVYFYDLRRRDWQPGVSDPQFDGHFDSTVREVLLVWSAGGEKVEVSGVSDITVANTTFRMVQFRYAVEGRRFVSRTYLTARDGSLLKYRVTFPAALADDIEAAAELLIVQTVKGPHPGILAAASGVWDDVAHVAAPDRRQGMSVPETRRAYGFP